MFSVDTETGCPRVTLINAAWGLGESVVQGAVDPDEYVVFEPFLEQPRLVPIVHKALGQKLHKSVDDIRGSAGTRTVSTSRRKRTTYVLGDEDILKLARWAVAIERH
jgi:pyruvate, water dikinase